MELLSGNRHQLGGFKWLSRGEIADLEISKIPDDGEFGYFFVVDLRYPPELHSMHNCYPMAVEHLSLGEEHLSDAVKPLLGGKRYPNVSQRQDRIRDSLSESQILPSARPHHHQDPQRCSLQTGSLVGQLHRDEHRISQGCQELF